MATNAVALFFLVILLSVAEHETATENVCAKWSQIATQLTGSGRTQTCTSPPAPNCTRLDCSGSIRFSHFMFSRHGQGPIAVDYCFGMQLNSCNSPISIDFYLVLPHWNIDHDIRISEDKNVAIPGFTIPLGTLGNVSPELDFKFEKQDDGNVTLSVKSKAKLNAYGTTMYVDQLERTLVDEETIPVLPCAHTIPDASSSPPKSFKERVCHQGEPPAAGAEASTLLPPATTVAPVKPPASKTLNQSCSLTSPCSQGEICDPASNETCQCQLEWKLMDDVCVTTSHHGSPCSHRDQCGYHEICTQQGSKGTVCSCEPGSGYDAVQQMCMRGETGTPEKNSSSSHPDVPAPAPHSGSGSGSEPGSQPAEAKTSPSKLPLIIGGSVGGVIVLALIVVANVYLFRRYRQRRHRREPGGGLLGDSDAPLLGADDDTDLIM
ncbi:uncharacterized protein LOC101846081 [Aplysia californica]|uniref:Uncharacterized protein LOC101846081 n=1 Tax=Aplysia californica TaxID=6500 RepID=A0ABM0JV21_APLCA|nr:uncharacterized protein LOC101846081 [Aplysia californica]